MKLKKLLVSTILLVAIALSCLSQHFISKLDQKTITFGNNPDAGKYVQVSDAKLYYEVYGEGEPIVLLNGGLMGSQPNLTSSYSIVLWWN